MKSPKRLAAALSAAALLCCTVSLGTFPAAAEQASPQNNVEATAMTEIAENTDITFRLMEAVRKAEAGSTIEIPAGEYLISASVKLRSGITIKGAGKDKTILTIAKDGLQAVFKADEKQDITLRDFAVNGANTVIKHVFIAENCTRVTVDSLHIYDLDGMTTPIAIYFVGTTDSIIKNCEFSNISVRSEWGCAVRLAHGSARNVVDNNIIRDTGRGGILCNNNSTHLTITNNTITGSGKTSEGLSIELWGDCGYSVVEDNSVDHWLSLDNAPYTAIRRNTVSDKTGTVKFLGLETVGSNNVVLTDNTVDHGQYIGISASNSDPKEYAYWGNTKVYGCQQWGAQFQGEEGFVRYQYFYNLQISGTYKDKAPIYPRDAGHGFRFNDSCEYFVFEGGNIFDNDGDGIQKLGHVKEVYFLDTEFSGNRGSKDGVPASMQITADKLPQVSFACPATVKVGEPVPFTGVSIGNDATIKHVLWDFGAGIPSDVIDPTCVYEKPGTYTVTLIVWNEQGLGGRAARTITVTE